MLLMALDCVSLCLWKLTHHMAPHSPRTHSPCHSPQAGVFRDAGVGAKGWSGELKGPGSKFCAHVGSRGAGDVSLTGRLECHSMWPVGSGAGVGQKGSSTVELGGDCPGVSGRLSVAPREELWVGPGTLGEKATLLAIHWLVPRPGHKYFSQNFQTNFLPSAPLSFSNLTQLLTGILTNLVMFNFSPLLPLLIKALIW